MTPPSESPATAEAWIESRVPTNSMVREALEGFDRETGRKPIWKVIAASQEDARRFYRELQSEDPELLRHEAASALVEGGWPVGELPSSQVAAKRKLVEDLLAAFRAKSGPGGSYQFLFYGAHRFAGYNGSDPHEAAAALLEYFATTSHRPTQNPQAIVSTTLNAAS